MCKSIIEDAINSPLNPGYLWDTFTGQRGQEETNKANLAIAQQQMEFQERMSSTAHQREVEDLRKAGINPILSAGGPGASSPGGASAHMENPQAGIKDAVMAVVQMMTNMSQTSANISNINANTAKTLAETPDPSIFKKLYEAQAEREGYSAQQAGLDMARRKVMSQAWQALYDSINFAKDQPKEMKSIIGDLFKQMYRNDSSAGDVLY